MRKPGTEVPGRNQAEPSPVRDTTMAHKYPNVLIHCVFSTKNREDLIPDELRLTLWKYLAGIGKNHGIPVLSVGGIANHAHLLIALPSDIPLAKAIQVLKANSSRWLGEHGIDFARQEGYGAFSVSCSNVAAVKEYIERQPEHHNKRSYEDEFIALLNKSGVTYDLEQVFG
jgi:putative transposase